MRRLTIGWLYPRLMGTYGDRGNITALLNRARWRGIGVEVVQIELASSARDLMGCDMLFMGGAQDREQKIAAVDLRLRKGPAIRAAVADGMPALFVCAAYQFMGHYYRPAEGPDLAGVGLFDIVTHHLGVHVPRCIGNIAIELAPALTDWPIPTLVGFENHGGRTYLGPKATPLGAVIAGYGNNGVDRTEGAVVHNALGCYLHGPVLPKNPHLADHLLRLALRHSRQDESLAPLDDRLEWAAHEAALRRAGVRPPVVEAEPDTPRRRLADILPWPGRPKEREHRKAV
ncbi:MAG: cobalamin biosynthesis protein CobQ [Anaerolineae bacterium]|nr:cobalamin biosynthesis protein CobQ [Anaerolineae bacterium]